jgi:hypothetical protein
MTVRMWEVRAVSSSAAAALVEWLLKVAIPAVAGRPGYDHAEVFTGAEDRVVVLSWWQGGSEALPEPPPDLLVRPAHSWEFVSVGVR